MDVPELSPELRKKTMSFKFSLKQLVTMEVAFLERYGFAVPQELNRESIERLTDHEHESELMRIYGKLRQLTEPETDHFCSSDYERILAACPGTGQTGIPALSELSVKDKIHGGWLGRAAGCILGKPLECNLTLSEIKEYLGDEFPLANYLRFSTAQRIVLDRKPKLHPNVTKPCSREHLAYAMQDDDLNYTALNLLLLEQKGSSFSRSDVGEVWASHLPPACTYGAETTAFVNYLYGMKIDSVPVYLNPFRDEIGAQIRADMFGYVCPDQPEVAAELAFRDASFSHVADGIYGAMFAAAMISSSYSANTMGDIVSAGLHHIPEKSRTAEIVANTVEWYASLGNWEAVYSKIKASTPQYNAGHTVNNAAYVVNAVLASDGDFEKGITIASMQGHDTDCNGATVGSILGVYLGKERLPEKWISPLNDCLKTNLRGLSEVSISEMAERTFGLALQKTREKHESNKPNAGDV
jgi:ADP-ribosylglycohydrolase